MLCNPDLTALAVDFTAAAQENRVNAGAALCPDLAGMRLYDAPVLSVGSASDPLFAVLRSPGVIGPHFRMPRDWLDGAQSVISFFLPFSGRVTEANRADPVTPAPEWLHACGEGKAMVRVLAEHLADVLRRAGYRAVVPSAEPQFHYQGGNAEAGAPPRAEETPGSHDARTATSNWSERHVAFVCGQGTFGLSAGLITKKGVAGAFGSVVSDIGLAPDARDYAGHMDYCTRCGECARRCPAGAITLERGKDHGLCRAQSQRSGRYGCGKCQTGVPCGKGIPGRI